MQLFNYSSIRLSMLLVCGQMFYNNVENPLLGKVLKFLLLPSIRQADLWGYGQRIFFKLYSLGTTSWSLWLKWSLPKSPVTGQWPTFAWY